MLKKWLKQRMPHPDTIKNNRYLKIFGSHLHNHYLWYFNRHCVSRAVAIGLFWALIPMPFQMLPAAICAIFCRANLPLSIGLVWLTNPLTMPPIFFFSYKVGTWIMQHPTFIEENQSTWTWFSQHMHAIWQPLYLGSLVCASVLSISGYCLVRLLWRWNIVSAWRKRRQKTK